MEKTICKECGESFKCIDIYEELCEFCDEQYRLDQEYDIQISLAEDVCTNELIMAEYKNTITNEYKEEVFGSRV